jgi:hypothetical protein
MPAVMVISSDLHLEPHAWARHPGLAGDAYYGLIQLVDMALAMNVKAVGLLGDIFNTKTPDSHTVYVICRQLDRLQKAGVKCVHIQGNHEFARSTPWLGIHTWPMHIHKLCLEITPDIIGYGLDWLPAGKIKQELAQIPPEANLLLCHQVWGDFHGSAIEHECSFSDVPSHVRMLVTGDYHKHLLLKAKNATKEMIVGSPGSTCLQSINENPNKSCFVLYDNMALTSRAIRSRWVYRLTANTPEELDSILKPDYVGALYEPQNGVPESIAKPIVHVTFDNNILNAYSRLERALGKKTHLFAVPIRVEPEQIAIDRSARQAAAYKGLAGALSLILADDSPVKTDAVRLYNATNPDEELAVMKEEFLKDEAQRQPARGPQGDGLGLRGRDQVPGEGQGVV